MTTHTPDRLHALDAARGFALLLGIVLHASMSFFLGIPARDVSQSTTLGVTFFVIHIFRMTLFFVVAGFFAHLVFHRRGTRAFVKDRAKRVLVPLTAGWLILGPATLAAVIWGLKKTYGGGADGGAGAAGPQGFPLVHLWFLYYLCICYALVLGIRPLITALDRQGTLRRGVDAILGRAVAWYLAPIALAAPLFAVLYTSPSWPVWFGIPTPDTGFMPQIPALAGYGIAFAFGWVLHRQLDALQVLRRQWTVNLIVAAGLTVTCLSIVGLAPDLATATTIEGGAGTRVLYAAAYTLAIWYWTLGLLGAAMRFCASESPARRYLADSSYWLYLVHPPIVFGLQALVMNVPISWMIKFPAILLLSLAVLFASYHYLVRPSFIGEILNGRRYPRLKAQPLVGAAPPISLALAELTGVTKRYGKALALDDLTLSVQPGELLALLGPNGAGKTTAIGLWLGTLERDTGNVTLMGGSPFDVHSRLGVGVMMQDVTLAPMLSAREHIALAASYYRDPMSVEAVIALTGIAEFAGRRYGKLSTGQKRQVQFALAVCGRPRLLFLDEPTVGLDVQARETMWKAIRSLLAEGRSIVLTTHYLEEAEALANRVVVLARGKVIAAGSVEEMRALVTRKRISCATVLAPEAIKLWPGVVEVVQDSRLVHVTAFDAESVVRRWLDADPALTHLEVKQASLAEAFTELTKEAA